ncbi:MAG: transcription termination factor Rho [Opitutales bacterium]
MSEENLEPSQSEMSEVVSKSAKKATKRVAKKATKTTAKKATKRTAKKAVKRVAKKSDTAETAVAAAEQADLFESGVAKPEVMPTAPANQDAPTSPEPSSQDVEHASEPETTGQQPSAHSSAKPHAPRPSHERSNRPNKFNKNKRNKRGSNGRGKPNKRFGAAEAFVADYATMAEEVAYASEDSLSELEAASVDTVQPVFNFSAIYEQKQAELYQLARDMEANIPTSPNRAKLLLALVKKASEQKRAIHVQGVFELLSDDLGGLLVYQSDNYRIQPLSAFVPNVLVQAYGLQRGHIVEAIVKAPEQTDQLPVVLSLTSVMGREPSTLSELTPFTELVPYYPLDRILLESEGEKKWDNLSMRVVDCLTPIGFGQRGLIVAPPRTGKTVLMQGMANAIKKRYAQAHLMILLIDERPEEVTDFRRQVGGEVISSTFDESAESHVHAAEMVIEKARRMVEVGQDVVILLDSITRLARAYNTVMPSSGKILSGGVEANALQLPKRFFGSARNIEGGGSLTILATALVETGSKMDEVIFEEFKGTGNMELHLDRSLSDKRIYPALSLDKSGTRKEELLYHPDEIIKIYSLRRAMKGLPSADAMEMLIQRIKKTNTNIEFLMSVAR